MKYSEANKKVKKLDSRLSIESGKDGSDCFSSVIYLRHSGRLIAWIYDSENAMTDNKDLFESANTSIHPSYKAIKILIELHETPVEEREDEKKYYIKVASIDGGLYLNYVKEEKNFTFSTKNEIPTHQTQFTKQEVNSWLKATTLAIDWDKALEEVPGDEVSDD
ncbi:Hypothetical protein [Lactobacillus plantarum ZJ316] [Lactiplantibacillus mudanjiangensis]|uniref:hypothetical protein n=1 Tax=Lactiplantibacillus mudanjiangensis TaxID=1296538 RepID=UPI0010143622|nr:hypothetical protein [Lactiplantibacillus mudanjiangensis]VDG31486.1 Hypothetical protein [Lactobacillus plantarum ZJ316] [Lactiplantibacillus mudanjiangensis]